jgi:hypothetical protein
MMTGNRKHPALNVAGWITYGFRWPLIIYWILYVLMFIGLGIADSIFNFSGDNASSIWEGFGISPKIFLMVLGIMLTPFMLAGFVSNGVTRRRFVQGVTLMIGLLSVLFALVITIAYPVEAYIFEQKGWPIELDSHHIFTSREQYVLIFLEHLLTFFTYFGSGWMFGSLFYRFDWRIAMLLLLPAMAPFILLEVAVSLNGISEKLGLTLGLTQLIGLLICLVTAASVIWLNYAMLRTVTIKKKATV